MTRRLANGILYRLFTDLTDHGSAFAPQSGSYGATRKEPCMAWKKADLLAYLTGKFSKVSAPIILEAASPANGNSNRYQVNVAAIGTNVDQSQFVGNNLNLNFLVYDEGLAGEVAVMEGNEALNYVNRDLTSADTLDGVAKINYSMDMKKRTAAAIIKATQAVRWEAVGTPNHALRIAWSKAALLNLENYTTVCHALVSNDVAILAAGGAAGDAQIQNIVNGSIEYLAGLFGLS